MDGKGLWISAEIMADERLNLIEKMILAEIQNLAQCGEVFATNKHFANIASCHEKHVSRVLKGFVELNLITMQIVYKTGTKEVEKRILTPQPNVTTLVTESYYPSNQELLPPSNPVLPINNKSFKKQIKKQIKDKNIYEQEFELLWKLYPRKKGRDKALQAYIKARKEKTEYETVKIGLEMYIQYVQTQQTAEQYIKHGSTWFNQKSWQDDYTTVTNRPKGYFGLLYDQMDTDNIFEERREVNGQDRGNQNFDNLTELLPEPIQEYRGQNSFEPYSANVGEEFF